MELGATSRLLVGEHRLVATDESLEVLTVYTTSEARESGVSGMTLIQQLMSASAISF